MPGRRALPTFALCVAATLAAAPVASACDAGAHARAAKAIPRHARAPLIVGDSTMILATPYLGQRGIEADAHGCRQLGQGVEMLARRRRAHALPAVALLALGANGAVSAGAIARALQIMGRRRILGLVTPKRAGSGSAGAMFRARRSHPDRVLVIDWATYSAGHGSWFAGDGLHVTYAGAKAFARLVRWRLEPFIGPSRRLAVPRTGRGAKACGSVLRGGRSRRVLIARRPQRMTCALARRLARRHPLRGIPGWRYYDFAHSGRRPWTDVYVRRDRRIVVVTR